MWPRVSKSHAEDEATFRTVNVSLSHKTKNPVSSRKAWQRQLPLTPGNRDDQVWDHPHLSINDSLKSIALMSFWEINKTSVSGTITTQWDCLAQPMQKEKKEKKVPANATAANPPGLQLQRQSPGGRQPPQPVKRATKSNPKDAPLQRRPRRGQRVRTLSLV